MGRPGASVIMVVGDDDVPVREALAALASQEPASLTGASSGESTVVSWELVVVDDTPTGRTAELAAEVAAALPDVRARVVRRPAAHSVVGARNTGAVAARGEVLAFCDAADRVAPGWLGALVRAVTAAVDAADAAIGGGSTSAWRADAFARLGGYRDLRRDPAVEDDDLRRRAGRAGLRVVDCPDAAVAPGPGARPAASPLARRLPDPRELAARRWRRHRIDDRAVHHLRADAPDGPESPRDRARLEVARAQRLTRTYRAGLRRPRPRDPLLVLCQPRTGSTLVFELLNQSAGYSIASEVLHRRIAIGPPPLPGPAVAMLHLDLTLRARQGSVVGAKLHLEQLDQAGLTPSDLLARYPDARILVLYRQSLLEQYVSMVTARQTGRWRLDAGDRPAPTTVRVDRDELAAFCDVQRARYHRSLDDPAVLAAGTILRYEDLAADPVGELRRSLADLGLELEPDVSTTLRRQSSGSVLDRIEDPTGIDPDDPLLQLDLGARASSPGSGHPR